MTLTIEAPAPPTITSWVHLHSLTFPEVAESKKPVADMCGYLVGGPDRKGPNAPPATKLWLIWQKDVQAASRRAGAVPQRVMDYFHQTKHLSRPPAGPEDLRDVPLGHEIHLTEDEHGGDTSLAKIDALNIICGPIEGVTGGLQIIDLAKPSERDHPEVTDVAWRPLEVVQVEDLTVLVPGKSLGSEVKAKKTPHFATSFSGMEAFLNCPRQWAAAKYYKTTPFIETEAIRWGNRVHKTAENYMLNAKHQGALPVEAECLPLVQKYCDVFLRSGATLHVEKEICCTKDLKLCGWKDWSTVWFRFKGDVITIKDRKLVYADFKTGKVKDDRFDNADLPTQVEVAIALADLEFGDLFDEATGMLIYVKETDPAKAVKKLPKPVTKADIPRIWEKIFAVTTRMESAWANEVFPARSSGLCKNYCDVRECPHCGKGR